MEDLNNKVTGGTLTAAEWNQVPGEIQNVIEALGIVLSSGDLNQLGKAIAGYVANGSFYTDSGAANAYVLATVGLKQTPTAYTDGMTVSFIAANVNTGASTINVAGLGVKNIKNRAGVDPIAGDIKVVQATVLRFDSGGDEFIMDSASIRALVNLTGNQSIPTGVSTALNFANEEYDSGVLHDNSTNNSRMTVPAGFTQARARANIALAANTTGNRDIVIQKNGASFEGRPVFRAAAPPTDDALIEVSSEWVEVVGGDFFEAFVTQESGGALDVKTSTSTSFYMEVR